MATATHQAAQPPMLLRIIWALDLNLYNISLFVIALFAVTLGGVSWWAKGPIFTILCTASVYALWSPDMRPSWPSAGRIGAIRFVRSGFLTSLYVCAGIGVPELITAWHHYIGQGGL